MAGERCKEILAKICAEAGKREDTPFCKVVAKHLDSCQDCRTQARSLRATLELYWCLERQEIPADVSARLRAALNLGETQDPPISS